MTLAILCSGQGRQHRDMFALTGGAPQAAGLFAQATTLLGGRDPREIVHTETVDALHRNRVAQILCALQALAAVTALRDAMPDRLVVAGYSVGEVAAWGVAGKLDMAAALDLVARRAETMDDASSAGEGLLFVRGLSRDAVDELCERHDAAIAIVQPAEAYVLGGRRASLGVVAREARAMQATRVLDLPVEVASHTKRLAKASTEFREILQNIPVSFPPTSGARLLSGIDGSPVIDAQSGLDKLALQISTTVQWADCLQGCVEAGATAFLELGPGRALCEMTAAAYRSVVARCLDDFKTLEGARAWLADHASQ